MNEPIENVLITALVLCVLCVVGGSVALILEFLFQADLLSGIFGATVLYSVFPIPFLLIALTWFQGWRAMKIWAATGVCLLPGFPIVHFAFCAIGLLGCTLP